MQTFFRRTIVAASLLFLAGLSFGQSGNLQYFKVGSDTILYNLDDVYEVIDLNTQVAMRFFKPTISVTATMTMEQFMARSCDQFVQVTVSPSGQERAFSKRFITHVKKDSNSGKGALYMMELNRTQLTEETIPYLISNFTSCGSSGGGGGSSESTVDTFYYTGDTLVLRTTEDTFSIQVTDESIEIGPTSLLMCGSSHAPGESIRDVFEGINSCLESYEVQLHPAVTLASGSNRALTLDTIAQVLELNLDADDSYDNSVSGLVSISIQDAIDELAARSSVLDGPFLVFELDTTLTNESQLVPDSTMYLTTDGDTTTIGVVAGGISIVHLNSLLRDSIFESNPAWLLDGNTVGGPGKFLGTIDSQRLYFKTDNLDRLWISDAEDRIYIGDSLSYGTMVFDTLSGEGLVFSTYRDVTTPESDPIRFRIKSDGSKTIFYEPLSVHERWIEIGLGIKDNSGSLGTAGQVATSDGTGWNWDDVDALPDGQRGETLWNNGSGWTVDSTIMNVGDSVSIIANSNLPFRVNNGTNNVFRVHNDGKTYWSDATGAASLFPVLSTSATASPSTGIGLMVYSNSATGTNFGAFSVSGVPLFSTTGVTYNIYSPKNFTPTSGTAQHTNLYVAGVINQTGSASGTVRGIHIDHTLTAASAYRALEISTVGGTGIYQSSTSTINQLRGATIIGAIGTPVRTLHVSGTARITGSVVGATGLLGVNLSNGDVAHVILGDGFVISNDTATATISIEGWTVSDGTNQEQISGETLTFVGVNGATVTFDSTTNIIEFDGNGGGGGPAGENNVGLNIGGGYEVYKTKSDTTFIFRTLDPQGILTITQNDTTLIMTATEVDGDSTNELQVVDTFDLSSGYLRISLSDEDSLHTVLLDSLLGWYADADTGDSDDLISGDTVHFVGANGMVIDYDAATKTFTVDGAAYVLPPGVSTQTLRYDTNDSLVANSTLINDGSRLAINTTIASPYDLRTNADIQVNGVRVGAPGDSTNVLVGSGIPSVSGGINNTVIGDLAMTGLTSGDYNTSVGYRSAYGLTSGQYNTLLGMGSGEAITTQSGLTGVGYRALYGASGVQNTAVGYLAMTATGSGGYNSVFGYGTLQANTSGNYNTALGRNALAANTTGSSNISIGYNALDATATISSNLGVGNDALGDITAGAFNVAVGNEALLTNTSSSGSVAFGYQAGKNTANGGGSIFLGYKSGLNYTTQDSVLIIESGADSVGLITGDFTTDRVGINLGPASTGRTLDVNGEMRVRDLTTTTPTLIMGADANGVLSKIVIGDYLSLSGDTLNAAVVGGGALPPGVFPQTLRYDSNDSLVATSTLVNNGDRIAVNDTCLAPYDINTSTDILIGDMRAGRGNSSVATNTTLGVNGLNAITSATNTTAIGNNAGRVLTSGNYNTFIGSNAGYTGTTSGSNTAVGYNSLYTNASTHYNTALGMQALADLTSGGKNVAVGYQALGSGSTYSQNVAVGYQSGLNSAVTGNSIFLGYQAGYGYDYPTALIIENSLDSVGLITGDFTNTRVGINLGPKAGTRTLDVNGEFRVRDLTTTNPTRLTGADANGAFSGVKLGTNLSFSNDTLNATGGSGAWPYGDFNPTYLGGINATKDSITNTVVPFHDDLGLSYYQAHNVRIQNDTIHALRGSYFNAYESSAWSKTVAPAATDTIDIDSYAAFDFTEAGGRYTYVEPAQYKYVPAGYDGWNHVFRIHGQISLSTPAAADAKLFLYASGFVKNECAAEFSTPGSDRKVTVTVDCLLSIGDGSILDLRIQNDESGSVTYLIERAMLNANHIKSILQPAF